MSNVIQLNPCSYCPGRIKEGEVTIVDNGKVYHALCYHNALETGTIEKDAS